MTFVTVAIWRLNFNLVDCVIKKNQIKFKIFCCSTSKYFFIHILFQSKGVIAKGTFDWCGYALCRNIFSNLKPFKTLQIRSQRHTWYIYIYLWWGTNWNTWRFDMRLALPNYLFGFGLYANFQSHGAHHDYFAHFSFKLSLTTAWNAEAQWKKLIKLI